MGVGGSGVGVGGSGVGVPQIVSSSDRFTWFSFYLPSMRSSHLEMSVSHGDFSFRTAIFHLNHLSLGLLLCLLFNQGCVFLVPQIFLLSLDMV